MSFSEIIQAKFKILCNSTNCDQRLLDECWSQKILEEDEKDEILLQNPPTPYAKSRTFYNILLKKKRKSDIQKLLSIFSHGETKQLDEVISILETCLESTDGGGWNSEDEEEPYVLTGTSDKLLEFSVSINSPNCTVVEMVYVDIDYAQLWTCLSQFPKLKSLILNPIRLGGGSFEEGLSSRPKLKFPCLEEYKFDRLEDPSTRKRSILNKMMRADSSCDTEKQNFKSNVFFQKDQDWDVTEILDLNTNIEVSIGGKILFSVKHQSGTIISTLDFTDEILTASKDYFEVKELALHNCPIPASLGGSINKLECLTRLNLHRVNVPPTIIQKCVNLQFLSIWKCLPSNLTLSVSDFSKSMKELTLAQVRIQYAPNVELNHLEMIYFDQCWMDNDVLQNFPSIFNSKRVSINPFKQNGCTLQMHPLLSNILKNPKTKSIRMWMFRKFQKGYEPPQFEEIEEFLNNKNLRSGRNRCSDDDERFILTKSKDEWKGIRLSRSERDQLYFDLFGGEYFWKSLEVYNRQ